MEGPTQIGTALFFAELSVTTFGAFPREFSPPCLHGRDSELALPVFSDGWATGR